MTTTDKDLASLLAACRLLMRSILTLSRSDGDPRGSTLRVRTAKKHVQRAVLSLQLDGETAGSLAGPAGSLERIAATLTTRLVQDLLAEVDCEQGADINERVAPAHDRDGFHGYSWAIPLPDLMGFLQMQQKSGVLRVNIGTEVISLIFDRGDLIHASSDNSPQGSRLGEILVAQGAIEMNSLEAFLLRCSTTPGRLGDALESEGLISKQTLKRALDRQVEGIFERLFRAPNAYYTFREGHSEEGASVRRNVCQLLLETCRVRDEAQRGEPGTAA